MKLTFSILVASILGSPLFSVQFIWQSPEEFRDFKISSHGSAKERAELVDQFEAFAVETLSYDDFDGLKIVLTIEEVDMAGRFEWWRRSGLDDVRIVDGRIEPAMLVFSYTISNESGELLTSGRFKQKHDHLLGPDIRSRTTQLPYICDLFRDGVSQMRRELKEN